MIILDKKGQEVKYIKDKDLKNKRVFEMEKKIVFLNFINIGVNVAFSMNL